MNNLQCTFHDLTEKIPVAQLGSAHKLITLVCSREVRSYVLVVNLDVP